MSVSGVLASRYYTSSLPQEDLALMAKPSRDEFQRRQGLKAISSPEEYSSRNLEISAFYTKALAYRDFLDRLSGPERGIFEKLLNNDNFIQALCANQRCRPFYFVDFNCQKESIDFKRLSTLISELAARLYCVSGRTVFVPKEINQAGHRIQIVLVPDNDTYLCSLESLYLTNQELSNFRAIASGQARYHNPYAKPLRTVAMITHNCDQVAERISEFMDSVIRYGHCDDERRRLQFLVIDDSNDELAKQNARKASIEKLTEEYRAYNIDLQIVDTQVKERIIADIQEINSDDKFREGVRAALSPTGGTGAQRNWANLFQALTLDHDTHPYSSIELGDQVRALPVDYFGALTREIADPQVYSVHFPYSGKASVGFGFKEASRLLSSSNLVDVYKLATHSYSAVNLIKQSSLGSGGVELHRSVVSPSPLWELPFVPDTKYSQCLRVEDTLQNFRSVGFHSQIIYKLGSSVHHELPEKAALSKSMIQQGILEPIAIALSQKVIPLPRTEDVSSSDIAGIGCKLELALHPSTKLFDTKDDSYDVLIQNIKGWFIAMYNASLEISDTEYPISNAERAYSLIQEVFRDLGILDSYKRFKEAPRSFDWKTLDLSEIERIMREEFLNYSKAIQAWPSIVQYARSNRKKLDSFITQSA